jgi:hypothetical protein
VSNKDVKQDALDNLADALTEDILNTPDNELLREVEEDYGDPRALANKFDQILERAEKQAFGTARPAASPQVRSSARDLLYHLREWASSLFGAGPGRYSVVWAGAAAVLIAVILASAVFRSLSEFDERSEQLAAQGRELLARSEQLAAQEKELLARSEQLVAREEELRPKTALSLAPSEMPATQDEPSIPSILCETHIFVDPSGRDTEWRRPLLVCADDDLAFWQNLVSEIYRHRWERLDRNGRQTLLQGQLDWLKNVRVNCNAAFQVPVSGTEMARAKSCVLHSTKERVAVLSNN